MAPQMKTTSKEGVLDASVDDVVVCNLSEPLLPSSEASVQSSSGPVEENNGNGSSSTPISRNVRLTLIYSALAFAGRSIWNQSVLAAYVFLLRNNNPEPVGYITAVMGLCQLLASFPAGYFADRLRRDVLLRLGSVVGLFAVCLTLLACYTENYIHLVIALAVWGVCFGTANTCLTALFADSIPEGKRSYYFTQRSILITLGNTGGPICSLAMFYFLGDKWTIRDCSMVMALGQAFCFPAVLLLCFFRDNEKVVHVSNTAIDISSERQLRADSPLLEATLSVENAESNKNMQEEGQSSSESRTTAPSQSSDDQHHDATSYISVLGLSLPSNRVIPVMIAMSDVISGLGSGMSIRYFPIFFVDYLKLGPVIVQILYVSSPLLQSALMKIVQVLSKRFGRCHVTVVFKLIGIFLMYCMVVSYWFKSPAWFVCVLYVLRTAFMNSTSALTRSLLMDNVPSHERGKWSALESVNMFSWSGSAALGGVLVGLLGITPLFCITALIQFISAMVVAALISVDKGENNDEDGNNQ